MANLPLDRCAVPVNLPVTVSPSAAAEWQRLAPGHLRTDSGHFPFPQIGEQVAPIENASILLPRGIALCDMMLTPLVHSLAHLLTEPCRGKVRSVRRHQSPVQPGRTIGADLLFQIEGRDDADAGLPVATDIIGGSTALEVIGNAPLVSVDPFSNASAAQRLQSSDMGIDIALVITAKYTSLELRLFEVAARSVDTILRDRSDGAIGGPLRRICGANFNNAADTGIFDAGRGNAGKMVCSPVDAVHHERQVLAHLVGEIFVHDAAGDGCRGCCIVKLEGHRITFLPISLERLVHVADDVAALTEFTQRRFHLRAKFPDAGPVFGGQPHLFQFGETAQAKRAVELAACICRFMAQIEEPFIGLLGHGAVDAGEAVLIDFGRQLAALLNLGHGAEFQRGQFACSLTNTIGEIVAIDNQVLA